MWLTQLFPLMRIWLHHLYMDMHKIPATQFSVDPGYWHEMVACLDTDLTFRSRPPGTAIPIGGKLLEVRHRKVVNLDDVRSSLLSERRVWLRIRDPTSTRRILGPGSIRTLHMLSSWMSRLAPIRSIWPATTLDFYAAADACAHDQMAQIGGFINLPNCTVWFSERFIPSDFYQLDVEVNNNMQRDSMLRNLGTIGNCETVGEMHASSTLQFAYFKPLWQHWRRGWSQLLIHNKTPSCTVFGKIMHHGNHNWYPTGCFSYQWQSQRIGWCNFSMEFQWGSTTRCGPGSSNSI